ncbi:hypothetical protein [Methylophaga thalassica]|uniref:hypothetical protein n=1 Tax=Methylophaga thalassica TaxID=40223 RepID=UPI002E7ACCE2|nr:hypothetical protein [Methylophaga thalassica]WVI83646.1 hypothetical protein VSX76_00950 [Methylophaga thalassica]
MAEHNSELAPFDCDSLTSPSVVFTLSVQLYPHVAIRTTNTKISFITQAFIVTPNDWVKQSVL